jgi:2-amino-4-hydroxy-6-hydroxymethyldihydropteridine diphosphokinase
VTSSAVGLGSNLGDRHQTLSRAVAALAEIGTLRAVSSLYETAAVGPPQPDYFNAAVMVETPRSGRGILDALLEIERRAGRVRTERWGPRTLDLDLLLHGDERIDEPGLVVPHPRLGERRFVLEPLAEVWPDPELPDGRVIAELLEQVADQEVRKVSGLGWWEQGNRH